MGITHSILTVMLRTQDYLLVVSIYQCTFCSATAFTLLEYGLRQLEYGLYVIRLHNMLCMVTFCFPKLEYGLYMFYFYIHYGLCISALFFLKFCDFYLFKKQRESERESERERCLLSVTAPDSRLKPRLSTGESKDPSTRFILCWLPRDAPAGTGSKASPMTLAYLTVNLPFKIILAFLFLS